jgi:hypothetical protein
VVVGLALELSDKKTQFSSARRALVVTYRTRPQDVR